MKKIVALLDKILLCANALAAVCISGMVIIVLAEIIARAAFDYSIKMAWETGSYLLAASWFLAAGFTLRTSGHVRINVLTSKLSPSTLHLVEIFATCIGLVVCGTIWASLVQLCYDSIKFNKVSFTPMQTPLWIPQSIVALGATLLLLTMIVRLCLLMMKEETEKPFVSNE